MKEYQAQKEYVFPPRPSVRLVTDTMRFCAAELPRWHPVSVSGYHIREAGSTAAQELAFTLANGFAYVEAALAARLAVDEFAPRLSFFFNAHIDFFEEIAKYRAARRIWARWHARALWRHRRPLAPAALPHPDGGGVAHRAATRGEPGPGGRRGAGRCARRHPEPAHRRFRRGPGPADRAAARLALRTQQVIAEESGVVHVADPLGGSWFVEELTDELERQAEEVFAHLLAAGSGSVLEGVYACIDDGWFIAEITDAAYAFSTEAGQG